MPADTETYDSHYAEQEIEPILVQEQVSKHLAKIGVPPERAIHITTAIKYQMRAGIKDGESWEKDIKKAENYLHRARTGKWLGE